MVGMARTRSSSVSPTTTQESHLWLTDDEAHCRLLADSSAAFLIGFILDQQVTVQKAFKGPADLLERVGTIEPRELAAMPLEQLEAAFADKPALHRFPAAMAKRVREAMQLVVDEYDGDPARIWIEAADHADLRKRLGALPGFGDGKVTTTIAVLVQRCGVDVTGWQARVCEYGTLGDVDSPAALKEYQARKRAYKAAARAAAGD
jgi:uncharacterized HhH-GPD family protein